MLEMKTCSRCGVRSQVLDLGRPRCFSCGNVFGAEDPPPESNGYPVVDEGPPPPILEEPDLPRGKPLCPKCHRPASFREPECGYCGFLFGEGIERGARRDMVAHRGPLIDQLGATALIAGASSMITGPLGAMMFSPPVALGMGLLGLVVALIAGGLAWWMAAEDLPRMATAEVDPTGRRRTEIGLLTARLGIGAGFVLAAVWVVYLMMRLG